MAKMKEDPFTLKQHAALAALLKRVNQGRRASERLTAAQLQARLALHDRYDQMRSQLMTLGHASLQCSCLFDRSVITASDFPFAAIADAGYRAHGTRPLWKRLYRRSTKLTGRRSIRQIVVEHEPSSHWAPPFRITVIPKDWTGLLREDLQSVVELLPNCKLVLLELACDFPLDSIVDVAFIRKHLVSGKMWLGQAPSTDRYYRKWGPATGGKAIRAYAKWETYTMRNEWELRARFLRRNGISDLFDLHRVPEILREKHILFAEIDEAKLRARLSRSGVGTTQQTDIVRQVISRQTSLWEALKYLRATLGLKNVQRLLSPLDHVNRAVSDALADLSRQWQTAPTRLRSRPQP
jgi:hypothetical protein